MVAGTLVHIVVWLHHVGLVSLASPLFDRVAKHGQQGHAQGYDCAQDGSGFHGCLPHPLPMADQRVAEKIEAGKETLDERDHSARPPSHAQVLVRPAHG